MPLPGRKVRLIRILGAVLVVAASAGIGFSHSFRLGKRLEQLKQLERMTLLLKGEISYGCVSLPEALSSIGKKLPEPFAHFLGQVASRLKSYPDKSFQQIFQEEVEEDLAQSALTAKDKGALMQMGAFLGYLDKDMQLRTVDLYLQELDREIEDAGESTPGRQKLCRSLGIMGGLFLVILLI